MKIAGERQWQQTQRCPMCGNSGWISRDGSFAKIAHPCDCGRQNKKYVLYECGCLISGDGGDDGDKCPVHGMDWVDAGLTAEQAVEMIAKGGLPDIAEPPIQQEIDKFKKEVADFWQTCDRLIADGNFAGCKRSREDRKMEDPGFRQGPIRPANSRT